MCGIVGYIGNQTKKNIIEKLTLLEYRGYDSCGTAFFKNDNIVCVKTTQKIKHLEEMLENENMNTLAIAHTRWATHGKSTTINAHPHTSQNNVWAVVHNGIIENYKELKQKYLSDVIFKSQTDTEVIPALLEKRANDIKSFIEVCSLLKGSFAVCAITKNQKDKIYVAKNRSPLYLALNKNECICASDTYCLSSFSTFFELKDNEFAVMEQGKISFFNKSGKQIFKTGTENKITKYFSLNKHFSTFMEKEINEIPFCVQNLIDYYSKNKIELPFGIKNITNIIITGCGSAYHTGLIGEKYFKKLKINVSTVVASELRYNMPPINKNTLFVFISQSGETADTLACLNIVKNKCHTLAIVNAENSTLRYTADYSLFMQCGKEIAVATTKAFVNGVLLLYILAKHFENVKMNSTKQNLYKLKKNIAYTIKTFNYFELTKKISTLNNCFFIGRNIDYPLSMEASLKLKEIAYINCLSIPSGELKHGTLALIDENSIVFASITKTNLVEKNINNIKEIESRGGTVIITTTKNLDGYELKNVIKFNSTNEELDVLNLVVFYQLLALNVCLNKNLSPDKPRNLAKSVTVE